MLKKLHTGGDTPRYNAPLPPISEHNELDVSNEGAAVAVTNVGAEVETCGDAVLPQPYKDVPLSTLNEAEGALLNAVQDFNELHSDDDKFFELESVISAWQSAVAVAPIPSDGSKAGDSSVARWRSLNRLGKALLQWVIYFEYRDLVLSQSVSSQPYCTGQVSLRLNGQCHRVLMDFVEALSDDNPLRQPIENLVRGQALDGSELVQFSRGLIARAFIDAGADQSQDAVVLHVLWAVLDQAVEQPSQDQNQTTVFRFNADKIKHGMGLLNPLWYQGTLQEAKFKEACKAYLPKANIFYQKKFSQSLRHFRDCVVRSRVTDGPIRWRSPTQAPLSYYAESVAAHISEIKDLARTNLSVDLTPSLNHVALERFQSLLLQLQQWSSAEPESFAAHGAHNLVMELSDFMSGKSFFHRPIAHSAPIKPDFSNLECKQDWSGGEIKRSRSQNPLFTPTPYMRLNSDAIKNGTVFLTFHKFAGKLGPHSDAFSVRIKSQNARARSDQLKELMLHLEQQFIPYLSHDILHQVLDGAEFNDLKSQLRHYYGQQVDAGKSYFQVKSIAAALRATEGKYGSIEKLHHKVKQAYLDEMQGCIKLLVEELQGENPFMPRQANRLGDGALEHICERFQQPPFLVYRLIQDFLTDNRLLDYEVLGIGANRNGDLDRSADAKQTNVVRINHGPMANAFRALCLHRQGPIEAKMNAMRGVPIALKNMLVGESATHTGKARYRDDLEKALVDVLVTRWLSPPESGEANPRYKQFSRKLVKIDGRCQETWCPDPEGLYYYRGAWGGAQSFDSQNMQRVPFVISETGKVRAFGDPQSSDSSSAAMLKAQYHQLGLRRGDWLYSDTDRVLGFVERHDGQYLLSAKADIANTADMAALQRSAWKVGQGFMPLNLEKYFQFPRELCASFIQRMLTAAYHQTHSPLFEAVLAESGLAILKASMPNLAPELFDVNQSDILKAEYQEVLQEIAAKIQQWPEAADSKSLFNQIQDVQLILDGLEIKLLEHKAFYEKRSCVLDALAALQLLSERIVAWSGISGATELAHWRLPQSVETAKLIKTQAKAYAGFLAKALERPHKEMDIRDDVTPEMQYAHYFNNHGNWLELIARFGEFGASAMRSLSVLTDPEMRDQQIGRRHVGQQLFRGVSALGVGLAGGALVTTALSVKLIHDAPGLLDPLRDIVREPVRCGREQMRQHREKQGNASRLGWGGLGVLRGVGKTIVHRILYNGSGLRSLVKRAARKHDIRKLAADESALHVFQPRAGAVRQRRNKAKLHNFLTSLDPTES